MGQPKTSEKVLVASGCLRHTGVELKFLCTECSEAQQSLETRFKQVGRLGSDKENWVFRVQNCARLRVKQQSPLNTWHCVVNKAFDAIAASVEAQRNEALQHVSWGVKEIWSQKELMEVSLAQIDSFTRFVDRTSKCSSSTSYVTMATQGIKLMERLKDTHGDEDALEQKPVYIFGHSMVRALMFHWTRCLY